MEKTCRKCGYVGDLFAKNRHVCNECRKTQRNLTKLAEYLSSEKRKEQKRNAMATYRAKHHDKTLNTAKAYHEKRKLSRSSWADLRYMRDLKSNCREANVIFAPIGLVFETDHIVPLIHNNVCGLDNEMNMQVLTREENRAKYNKFEVSNGR